MQAELEKEDVDVGDVRDLLTKLTETTRKKRSELQLHRDDGLELHECFSLDDPVVRSSRTMGRTNWKGFGHGNGCEGAVEGVAET